MFLLSLIDCEWSWLANQLVMVHSETWLCSLQFLVWPWFGLRWRAARTNMDCFSWYKHTPSAWCMQFGSTTHLRNVGYNYMCTILLPLFHQTSEILACMHMVPQSFTQELCFFPLDFCCHIPPSTISSLNLAGHITESVVVASLGELLPQTSMEVRKKRLYLGAVMRIWSSLKYANIICAFIFAVHVHEIWKYYIYTLIFVYTIYM